MIATLRFLLIKAHKEGIAHLSYAMLKRIVEYVEECEKSNSTHPPAPPEASGD